MRIVGGRFAGRDLTSPQGWRVRPTSEEVRAALLDMLGAELSGARVLDLFAGTGALGLEALSRGARSADFVECEPDSLHALRANIASLRVRDRTRVFKRDAIPFVAALRPDSYDIVFADPPYGSRKLDRVLQSWHEVRFTRILAVEHARTHDVPPGYRRRNFGDTVITIFHTPGGKSRRSRPRSQPPQGPEERTEQGHEGHQGPAVRRQPSRRVERL